MSTCSSCETGLNNAFSLDCNLYMSYDLTTNDTQGTKLYIFINVPGSLSVKQTNTVCENRLSGINITTPISTNICTDPTEYLLLTDIPKLFPNMRYTGATKICGFTDLSNVVITICDKIQTTQKYKNYLAEVSNVCCNNPSSGCSCSKPGVASCQDCLEQSIKIDPGYEGGMTMYEPDHTSTVMKKFVCGNHFNLDQVFCLSGPIDGNLTMWAQDLEPLRKMQISDLSMVSLYPPRTITKPKTCGMRGANAIKPIKSKTTGKVGVDYFPPSIADIRVITGPILPSKHEYVVKLKAAAKPKAFSWLDTKFDILSALDQGGCGSCWAVSSSSVLSDRFAIKYNIKNPVLSAVPTLTCAAPVPSNLECASGGNVYNACVFFENTGTKMNTCWPYDIVRDESFNCVQNFPDGCCLDCCSGDKTDMKYYAVFKAEPGSSRNLYVTNPDGTIDIEGTTSIIQTELMNNGPVIAAYFCHDNFQIWWQKGAQGVYINDPTIKDNFGGHAVVILGWGTEVKPDGSELRYWIVRNSWGKTGNGTGIFKMAFSADIPEASRVGLDIPIYPTNPDGTKSKELFGGATTVQVSDLPKFNFPKNGPVEPVEPVVPHTPEESPIPIAIGIISILAIISIIVYFILKKKTKRS